MVSQKNPTPEEEAAKKIFNIGCLTSLGVIVVWVLFSIIYGAIETAVETPEQKAAKQAQIVNEWFISGSEISCENKLKGDLRDPNSYERDGDFTIPSDDGNKRVVTWKFRSKNGFGGYASGIGMCLVTKKNGGTVKATVFGQ